VYVVLFYLVKLLGVYSLGRMMRLCFVCVCIRLVMCVIWLVIGLLLLYVICIIVIFIDGFFCCDWCLSVW